MLNQFQTYIQKNNLCLKTDKILLGVSGGIDSIVMFHLFRMAGYHFAVAHCNFQLRGEESNQDEEFVKIGVTTRSIELRTKKIAQYYDIEILKYLKSDLKTISYHEQKILTHFKKLNYNPKIKFTGHTECFTLEILKYL